MKKLHGARCGKYGGFVKTVTSPTSKIALQVQMYVMTGT